MALITKANVAVALGIATTDIPDSVYTWATKQFFVLTGLSSAEVTRIYRKLLQTSTAYLKLPYTNIKNITTIKLDGVTQSFTLHTDVKFNPDTGVIWYSTGFGGGQLAEVTVTLNAFVAEDMHDYLITLLVAKSLAIFTPDVIKQVKMIKIGNYQKQYGGSSSNLEDYQASLEIEIGKVVAMIQGDDGHLAFGIIQ